MDTKKRPCYSPPTDAVGGLHNCLTTQGTIETAQAVRLPYSAAEIRNGENVSLDS